MLIIGPYNCIPEDTSKYTVLALFTYVEGYPRITFDFPTNVMSASEQDHDILFGSHILNNNISFIYLMTIIAKLYNHENVYLICDGLIDPIFEDMTLTLTKFINERYGYKSYYIYTKEDLDLAILEEYRDTSTFSVVGLYNFDLDMPRYVSITAHHMPNKVFKDYTSRDDKGNMFKEIRDDIFYLDIDELKS